MKSPKSLSHAASGPDLTDGQVRAAGALFLALSAIIAKYGVYDLVQRALDGAPDVAVSNGVAVLPAPLALGLLFAFGGRPAHQWLLAAQLDERRKMMIVVPLLVMGIALRIGLEQWLHSLGYA